MRTSPGKTVAGLCIEPGRLAAVETRSGGVEVERAAVAPLAPDVVRDGEVRDVDALAGALSELFTEHKLSRRVRIGVANQRIVMRTIELPPLQDAKQIASAVRFQAEEHIPMALEQAVFQHHSLGVVDTPDGPRTRVVLIAARRDMIDKLLAAVRGAGLRAHGIDLSAFAMIRSLREPGFDDSTLYISVGGVTNLAVATGATCAFTRVTTYGYAAMVGELSERQGLTLEHAGSWLAHVGLLSGLEEVSGDEDTVFAARAVLNDGIRRIGNEIRNSLDFYTMQPGADAVRRAVLTGPAVAIPGFTEHLGEALELPLQTGMARGVRPDSLNGFDPGELTVAAGLTVEEMAA